MVDIEVFSSRVREAFARLDDPLFLASHSLSEILARRGRTLSGEGVRRTLLDAFERLRPAAESPTHSTAWRRYHYLRRRYLYGESHEAISRALGISTRQARRDHIEALDAVIAVLWDTYQESPPAPEAVQAGDRWRENSDVSDPNGEIAQTVTSPDTGTSHLNDTIAGVLQLAVRLPTMRGVAIVADLPTGLPPAIADRSILRQILLALINYLSADSPLQLISLVANRAINNVTLRIVSTRLDEPSLVTDSDRPLSLRDEAEALLGAAQQLAKSHGIGIAFAARDLVVEVVVPTQKRTVVLVVDDNPGVARLFERYLHNTHYRIVTAANWQRALRLAEEVRPDAITLDVMMPSQDGWDILGRLKERPETSRIPVIVCSVLPGNSQALAFGATSVLPKPVTRESLLAALRSCLEPVSEENQAPLADS